MTTGCVKKLLGELTVFGGSEFRYSEVSQGGATLGGHVVHRSWFLLTLQCSVDRSFFADGSWLLLFVDAK